uniref:Uncharacterized protein n=1 Tax=Panagrolaimus sp. PS1159 TaxID=55785 RepID=A0AC35GG12_9BILA
MFGNETVKEFSRLLDIDMIVRAHEFCRNGHIFYCDKLLCTVFSAPNYCGSDGNCASVMKVSADLTFSFLTFKPKLDKSSLSKEKLAELEKQSKNADVKSPNPTLHKTVLPDRSHEEHEKAKQSISQTSTAAATETTQLIIEPLTTTSSSNDTFSSLRTPPTLSSLTKSKSTTSSITSEPITTKSSAITTPTTSKSTIYNSVTAVSTPTTSTGYIT